MAWTSRTWLGLGAAVIVSILFSVLDEFGILPNVRIFRTRASSPNLSDVFSAFTAIFVTEVGYSWYHSV